MKDSLHVEVFLSLIPLFGSYEREKVETSSIINDFIELNNKIEFSIDFIGKVTPFFRYVKHFTSSKLNAHENDGALAVSITVMTDYSEGVIRHGDGSPVDMNDQRNVESYQEWIAAELTAHVKQLCILSNLALPGAFKSSVAEAYVNHHLISTDAIGYSIHRESLETITEIGWPTYRRIPLLKVWEWGMESNLFCRRMSTNKIERALNAFTYLFDEFKPNDAGMDLFWSLVGIEAIYCSGKEGLAEQIFHKTQVILGTITDYKKRLKEMYNFRSRLVHGDLDIPPYGFFGNEDNSELESFQDDQYNATTLAVAILTATLQELILQNKTEFTFTYVST